MKQALPLLVPAFLVMTSIATGQLTEIPAMTVPHSVIDMDNVGPAGPTSLAAINAAATPAATAIAAINLTPSTAAAGVYNANPGQGRALAIDAAGGLILVDPPSGTFTAFNASIELGAPATEFGCSIGDWVSTVLFTCYSGGVAVGPALSISYSTGGIRYLQSTVPFDRVDIMASAAAGNWVIPDLVIQESGPIALLSQPSPGMVQIDNSGLQVGAETFNVITLNDPCPNGPGTGPLFGLCASTPAALNSLIFQVTTPISPNNPLHFGATAQTMMWGPYPISPGFTLEALCFYIDVSTGMPEVGTVTQLVTQ